ncbi:MAG: MFS transporter [Asgard group archaeon]|nr:MFS transporter [Asgard group archaeon]
MNTTFKNKLTGFLPPPVILPLLFSYMLEHIGISVYWIFFGLDIFETLGSSYTQIALIFAIPAMISIFGTTFLSNLADKTRKYKLIIIFSRVALMIQYVLLIFFRDNIWVILIILTSFGLVVQVYYSVNTALLTIICPPNRKGEVTSFQVIFASAGWMIGGGVSDLIKGRFGLEGNLGFAAFFVLCAGLIALISTTKSWKTKEKDDTGIDILEEKNEIDIPVETFEPNSLKKIEAKKRISFWDIIRRKKILYILLILIILDFGFGPFNSMTSLYFKEVYTENFQYLFSQPEQLEAFANRLIKLSNVIATAVGMIILLTFGRLIDKRGRKPFLLLSITFYPVIYSLMFFFSNHPWPMFIFYLYPLYALKVPTANTIMSDLTSENERARGMSLISIEQLFAGNLGAIIAALIADRFPGDWIPRFVPKGIYVIPLFPMIFGIIALVLAIFLIKETNPKAIEKKIKDNLVAAHLD